MSFSQKQHRNDSFFSDHNSSKRIDIDHIEQFVFLLDVSPCIQCTVKDLILIGLNSGKNDAEKIDLAMNAIAEQSKKIEEKNRSEYENCLTKILEKLVTKENAYHSELQYLANQLKMLRTVCLSVSKFKTQKKRQQHKEKTPSSPSIQWNAISNWMSAPKSGMPATNKHNAKIDSAVGQYNHL